MSTGIGRHKFVGQDPEVRDMGNYTTHAYTIYKAICPYCECPNCEADHVDIGVGMQQCGPYFCPECGASEISYLDTRKLTPEEKRTGWYAPGSPVSEMANTINGELVNHKIAKEAYESGILDTPYLKTEILDLDQLFDKLLG